jgi:hypothetical protein
MVAQVVGTIHPPPSRDGRVDIDDLTAAEIRVTNLGDGPATTPVLVEHEGGRVGRVLASWPGLDGSLRMVASISNPDAEAAIRNGHMRGLSLGSRVHHRAGEDPNTKGRVFQSLDEVSICEAPRRAGCYIETIDGEQTVVAAQASANAKTLRGQPSTDQSTSSCCSNLLPLPPPCCVSIFPSRLCTQYTHTHNRTLDT